MRALFAAPLVLLAIACPREELDLALSFAAGATAINSCQLSGPPPECVHGSEFKNSSPISCPSAAELWVVEGGVIVERAACRAFDSEACAGDEEPTLCAFAKMVDAVETGLAESGGLPLPAEPEDSRLILALFTSPIGDCVPEGAGCQNADHLWACFQLTLTGSEYDFGCGSCAPNQAPCAGEACFLDQCRSWLEASNSL